jgi:uncharacterized protein
MSKFIDSHVHVMPKWRLRGLARWILKAYPAHPVKEDITADDILDELKKQKVTHFFNFIYPLKSEETDKLNEFNAQFCLNTPGAIPFASMHQDTPDKAALAEELISKSPFVGFKFHPFVQRFDPWDSRMDGLYAFLQEAGKPVFFHTGFEDFYKLKMPVDKLVGLIKRYPRLPVVFVHMAFPDMSTCFKLLEDYPELTLDATNVLSFLRPEFEPMVKSMPNGYQIIDELIEGLETHSDRIMYGSDHPVGMGSLKGIYNDLEKLPISERARKEIREETPVAFVNRFSPGFDWERSLS